MKTSWQNFWIVIKFPIYTKGNTSEKNYFCKILKSKNGLLPTNFTKKKFFGLYLKPVLEKACGTGTTCRREH